MRSKEYWAKRSALDMVAYMRTADQTSKLISETSDLALDVIRKEIEGIFTSFSDFGISDAEARRILSVDGTMLQRIRRAAEKVKDPKQKQALLAAINSAGAYRWRIQRLEEVGKQITKQCRELYKTQLADTTNALRSVAEDAYYHTIFNVQKETGLAFSFAQFPKKQIDRILAFNWSGEHYSQRIWRNTEILAQAIKDEMLVSLLSGRSNAKTVRAIREQFNVNSFCAWRLVRTESSYVSNAAVSEGYKEADIEKYRFLATLDSRTSEKCAELDGKVFLLADKKVGTNFPPMHPFCRSTTLAEFGEETMKKLERRARDKDGKVMKVPADMTYQEWAEENGIIAKKTPEITKRVKPEFVPAKTIEEAQERAQKYCESRFTDRTFKGVADFKGISLDNANEIVRAIEDIYQEYDIPKITGIKAIDPNSAKGRKIFSAEDTVMAYSPIEHGVFINKNILKNAETLAAYNKRASDARDLVMQNIEMLSGTQKNIAIRYRDAGRDLVGNGSAYDYFTHEIGHHIQWDVLDVKTNNSVGSRMTEYAGKISGYATASKSEYLAESFAAYRKGEFELLDNEYIAFLNAKSLDKSAGSGIMELGSKFLSKSDPLYYNADKIKPIKGYDDIVFHGDPYHLIAYGNSGEEWLYNAKEAAEMIKHCQVFREKPIRLIACRIGAEQDGIAQQIADELGVVVLAPTETVFVDIDGDMFISNNRELAELWNMSSPEERKHIHQTGTWIPFEPKKR